MSLQRYLKDYGNSQLNDIAKEWSTWTPTLTWTTATPTGLTTVARYKQIGKTVFFQLRIFTSNGAGATEVAISLPVVPKTLTINPLMFNHIGINGAFSTRFVQFRPDGTNNDVKFMYMPMPNGQSAEIHINGFYEAQ